MMRGAVRRNALVACVRGFGLWSSGTGRARSGRQLPAFIQTQAWIRLAKAQRIGQIDRAVRPLRFVPRAGSGARILRFDPR